MIIDHCQLMIETASRAASGLNHRPATNHQSSIIDNQSSQAYRFDGAGIDADAAIDAVVRVYLRLAIDHANGAARALAHASLTPCALLLIDFGRHFVTLSKLPLITLEKTK
jgi:hypothetical protein